MLHAPCKTRAGAGANDGRQARPHATLRVKPARSGVCIHPPTHPTDRTPRTHQPRTRHTRAHTAPRATDRTPRTHQPQTRYTRAHRAPRATDRTPRTHQPRTRYTRAHRAPRATDRTPRTHQPRTPEHASIKPDTDNTKHMLYGT